MEYVWLGTELPLRALRRHMCSLDTSLFSLTCALFFCCTARNPLMICKLASTYIFSAALTHLFRRRYARSGFFSNTYLLAWYNYHLREWYISEVYLYFVMSLFLLISLVFALYEHSVGIALLAMSMITTSATTTLLAGWLLYRQANFDSVCSTNQVKLSLSLPCVAWIHFQKLLLNMSRLLVSPFWLFRPSCGVWPGSNDVRFGTDSIPVYVQMSHSSR